MSLQTGEKHDGFCVSWSGVTPTIEPRTRQAQFGNRPPLGLRRAPHPARSSRVSSPHSSARTSAAGSPSSFFFGQSVGHFGIGSCPSRSDSQHDWLNGLPACSPFWPQGTFFAFAELSGSEQSKRLSDICCVGEDVRDCRIAFDFNNLNAGRDWFRSCQLFL
jgi:hypothetical protein